MSNTASEPVCPTCDGIGWYLGVYQQDGEVIEQKVTCTCKAGRAIIDRRNQRLLTMSSLPVDRHTWTFDSFDSLDLTETQQYASKLVQTFANNGQVLERKGVYLYGGVGLGKSGLAAAAVNRAAGAGNTVLYLTTPDLLDHLRSTYAPNAEFRYDELMDRIKEVELLVLDDMGTEKSSPWAVEKLYQIIDHRNRTGKRLIVTSNLPPDDLLAHLEGVAPWTGVRIMDRIMAICTAVELIGHNLRKQQSSLRDE